ncbi:hypothetical protein HK105_202632 [Polyrhizophydium stewartii]|uniref:Adenine DNA glycosylase n=1 Tax=Polyrhizophydium stewartii TaxID=2732419 RepID=A0ABR4NE61_9FUNG
MPAAPAVRTLLFEWFDAHGRVLPWREPWSPPEPADSPAAAAWLARRAYRTWVSEIMLQQTQVATVRNYFDRWMQRWPTLADLAAADPEDVARAWAGLGYYSRARRLHAAARLVVDRHGGVLPSTVQGLREIPGIGPYTAGAIASIAFNVRAPLVDGNVVRVLSRLGAFGADPKSKAAVEHIWRVADALVDDRRPGDFNQALMDLGATVCTPLNPQCGGCPLQSQCVGHAESVEFGKIKAERLRAADPARSDAVAAAASAAPDADSDSCSVCSSVNIADIEDWPVTRYPAKAARRQPRQQACAVAVVERNGTFLVTKGPDSGLLAGMWDFPLEIITDVDPAAAQARKAPGTTAIERRHAINTLLDRLCAGTRVVTRTDLGSVVHVFTHIRRTMHVEHVILDGDAGLPTSQPASPSAAHIDRPAAAKKRGRRKASTDASDPADPATSTSVAAVQWVSLATLQDGDIAVPAPLKKVLKLLAAAAEAPAASKKRKAASRPKKRLLGESSEAESSAAESSSSAAESDSEDDRPKSKRPVKRSRGAQAPPPAGGSQPTLNRYFTRSTLSSHS